MLPGLSTVLRRDKERQRATGGAEGSPSATPSTPPVRREDSNGSAAGSSSISRRTIASTVPPPQSPPPAATATVAKRGPSMLPEEHRAREKERERLARAAHLGNVHTTQTMGNRQLQQSITAGPVAASPSNNTAADPTSSARYSSSHMESSVTRLLVATKMLLEALTKWSLGQRTENQVSDIYVRLGNDFNVANVAFGSYGIDMSDLASVPDDLRDCLERCLSEDASPQTLEVHLPRIREIIIGLLQGLKGKQAEYKQLLIHRRASARSSKSRPAERVSEAILLPSPASGGDSEGSQRTSTQAGHVEDDAVRRSVIGRRPMHAPPIDDGASSGGVGSGTSLRGSHRRSRREQGGGGGGGEGGQSTPPYIEAGSEEAALGLVTAPSPEKQLPRSQTVGTLNGVETAALGEIGDAADPSVRALKSRDALERRASKRFSAYTFNKMGVGLNQGLGMSSYGLPGTGSAMSSPATERTPSRLGGHSSIKKGLNRSLSTEMSAYDTPTKGALRERGAPTSDTISESDAPQRKKGSRTSPRHSPRPSNALSLVPPPMPVMKEQANSSTESLPYMDAQSPTKEVFREDLPAANRASGAALAVPPVPPLPSPEEQARLDAVRTGASSARRSSGTRTPTASSYAAAQAKATSMPLFLQLGRQTKKVVVELDHTLPFKGLSTGKFRMLFIDRFSYSPGKEDFPTLYVKDVHSGVSYELEDLNEITDGTVLTLNIEPLDQVKQHLDLTLGGITRELRDLKTTIQEREREWTRRASAQPSDGLAPPLSPQTRISDAQFALAGARVAQYKRATMFLGRENDSDNTAANMASGEHGSDKGKSQTSFDAAPRPKSAGGWQMAGDQLKKQYEEVLNVRRQLAVMGQIHEDFKSDVGGLLGVVRTQAKRVRAIAANEVPTERNFIIAGKARLDSNSQEILTLVEDLLDLVDDLKADVIQRGVKPKPHTMKKLGEDISRATRGLEDLSKYVDLVKPSWKKTWEMELQNIVDEQEFLNHQEGLIADLKEDHANLQDVFHNIQEVVKLRGANKYNLLGGGGVETGLSNISLRTYVPPAPEEGHEGLSTVMMEVKTQNVDHEKRLKALEAAEKQRLKELQQRKLQEDEFQSELTTFVDGKALRKTGGYLETERVRGRRDKLTLQAMFGAGGVGGAPVAPTIGNGQGNENRIVEDVEESEEEGEEEENDNDDDDDDDDDDDEYTEQDEVEDEDEHQAH